MRKLSLMLILPILFSCAGVMRYGYLSPGPYRYYESTQTVDLLQKHFALLILDKRAGVTSIACSQEPMERLSSLEGDPIGYLHDYLRAFINNCNGIYDSASADTLILELEAFDSKIIGFGWGRVFAYVQFKAQYRQFTNSYCLELGDGDPGAPLGKASLSFRDSAPYIMVSGCTRLLFERLIADLGKNL
jgi:hypothetical protein